MINNKSIFLGAMLSVAMMANAQISLKLSSSSVFPNQEVYIYGVNGSKDIMLGREKTNNKGELNFSSKQNYIGLMKAYFPDENFTVRFVSENKPVSIVINQDKKITYLDEANKMMNTAQELMHKSEIILPALVQIAGYYEPSSAFGKALDQEINFLKNTNTNTSAYPFVTYYLTTFSKYGKQMTGKEKNIKGEDFISFINKSGPYLESSGLLRTILLNYLNISGKNPEQATDDMMAVLQYETPRGQTVLSEFIDIFDAYGMKDTKQKYLANAQNLKCTINDRLAKTIKANKDTSVGATLPNYTFVNAISTKAKTVHEVKADKKVIVFWSSTCAHCETELPKILEKYPQMKQKGIEVIGLSLDADKANYENKANMYPWINASELRGWNSSFVSIYNVHGTPSYYVVDNKNKIIAAPEHLQDLLQFLGL
ncbi:TlpA family protein disulfide reductase [Bergeyella zoohelcum]|uniref:Thiol-disulfide oxidoreductase n=1 Tax=Bergeyella zoohelcum TaxID=1015 RepID=A0A7Z8YPJ6_9FLAO|nr:TlpA disulfide reductase family protein [Bergeyella zoohelcum]VDH04081.1 thiol-disulfide oxidoreductase [Bergeyella zoohelcum]